MEHILLDVTIEPKNKVVRGSVTHKLRAVSPDQKWIVLDQVGLKIEETKVNGKTAHHAIEGEKLRIDLDSAQAANPEPGASIELVIQYRAERPRRGLYFTGPDADYPNKPYQVWSQGQDQDNHFWFPVFDYPNQKATSEVIARVPKGFTAVSNGALLSKTDQGETAQYHYKLGTPHVTYLITLAVAEFTEWADQGPRGLPVQYFVQPGKEEDGKRSFSHTPAMIETFEKKIGVPYAYEKYSQVAVQDFIFGGMENTSATTQTDLTLHDARAHLDFTSDPLVSHELAHQWFGDLLTCRDWSHGWLNEGFATFMERVWVENRKGPDGGLDEGKYYGLQDLKAYLDSDRGHYRRPIVCNTYVEPIDLFDTHLYQKGGQVLNLIRGVLGEELFWKSVNLYVTRHKGQSVETLDLIRAIEDATGRNLRRLFDEWIFGAGYPEFELSFNWHEDKKLAEIVVEQKQTGGQPSVTADGATTYLFHLPVVFELTLAEGKKVTHRIEIGEARERIFLAAPSKPLMVRFDPNHTIPKTLKFPRPKEMLVYQLHNDSDITGRIEAARELAKAGSDLDTVRALEKALLEDGFWGVQADVAAAISELRTEHARDALIRGLAVKNPKARRGVVRALGTFKGDAKAAEALKRLAERDESYFVEADAISAWTNASLEAGLASREEAARAERVEGFLLEALARPSYREVIRSAALRALAQLPGVSRGERPRATQAIIEWTRRGRELDARMTAIEALGSVARTATPPEKARAFEVFVALADEDNFRIRVKLAHTLGQTGAGEAVGLLRKIHAIDSDGRVRRDALDAIDSLTGPGAGEESVSRLKGTLDLLEREYQKLKTQLEDLRASQDKRPGL